jgi:hypothetical protein
MTPDAFRRLFATERARFARSYPHVARATLHLSPRAVSPHGRAERDVAWCTWHTTPTGRRNRMHVWFLLRALALPRANLVALVRHEFGHLADPDIDAPGPGAEARADRIAREVSGAAIRYDARDLQTTATGRGTRARRPAHLHQ